VHLLGLDIALILK